MASRSPKNRLTPARKLARKRLSASVRKQREAVEKAQTRRTAQAVSAVFQRLLRILERRLPKDDDTGVKELPRKLDPARLVDWDAFEKDLGKTLRKQAISVAERAYADVATQLGIEVALDLNSRGMQRVIGNIGQRVKGITEESRQRLISIVNTGIDNGDSPAQVARTMLDSVKGWAGLEDLSRSRAMTIARTETAHAYTWSSAAAYRDSDLVQKVLCLDSPDCGWDGHDDSELADGTERTLDEMEAYPTSHPNCVRAFAPIVATE